MKLKAQEKALGYSRLPVAVRRRKMIGLRENGRMDGGKHGPGGNKWAENIRGLKET